MVDMGAIRLLRRLGAVAALVLACLLAAPATAQDTDVDRLEALAADIEDEAKRKELVGHIRALIAVRRGLVEEAPVESLGARFIATLSDNVRETSSQLLSAAETLSDLPALGRWLRDQAGDADARGLLLGLLVKLGLILAAGIAGERLSGFLLSRPRRALEGREAETLMVRVPLLAARTVLDVIPVAVFAGAAYAVVALTRPEPAVHVVVLTFINAYLIARAILVAVRMLLVPAAPNLRVLALSGETANYLFIWCRRLTTVSVFGYFLAEAALLLGLPAGGHATLLRLLGLLVMGMAILFIQQNRVAVAAWIRGADAADGEDAGALLGLRGLRRRFADIWHVLAILYAIGMYAVWALDIEGGFEFLLRATVVSAVILAAARLAAVLLGRGIERGFAVGDDVKARFPTIEERANRYLPVLHMVLRTVVYVLAALALFQAWGIDVFGWLETPFGLRLTHGAFSIAAILVLALVVWEAINSAVEHYLNKTDAEGNVIERSARARTLLPLIRNAVLVVLAVLVTLIVLSELGINIAPLLAGAGVVGLAVGFGAQKLVQDVITGAFILFEDAISVGDVVAVAGHAGIVEALSIRSIRLRDLSGSVYTIPFSSVDTVTNMTKDFSYAVLEVGVAYREDTDRVTEVLEEIGAGMQEDPAFGPLILEPLQVLGVDRLGDSAVVIKVRFKTAPIQQWGIRREFNRRMKKRFDELGIEIPFPHTTLYFGEDKTGRAPPARVVSETPHPAPAAPVLAAHAPGAPAARGEPPDDDGE